MGASSASGPDGGGRSDVEEGRNEINSFSGFRSMTVVFVQ